MSFTCMHCNHIFVTEANLKTHITTAKYCLKIQGIDVVPQYKCGVCSLQFVQKQTYTRHLKICETTQKTREKEKDDIAATKITTLEKLLADANLENVDIKKLLKERDEEISKLKEALAYEKGQFDGYQKVKPANKITQNNNKNCVTAKIANLPITTIKPFTIEAISELLPQYTYEHFLQKVHGMLEIIVPFTTLNVNGVIERNIVCTDTSRTICHLLSDDRIWNIDNGLTICDQIVKLFVPQMKIYFQEVTNNFQEVFAKVRAEEGKLQKSDYYAHNKNNMERALEQLDDVKFFYYGALLGKGEDYEKLIRSFRDLLKPGIHIKSNTLSIK